MSQQDALLVGGKVQAPGGMPTAWYFCIPTSASAAAPSCASRCAPGRHSGRGKDALALQDRAVFPRTELSVPCGRRCRLGQLEEKRQVAARVCVLELMLPPRLDCAVQTEIEIPQRKTRRIRRAGHCGCNPTKVEALRGWPERGPRRRAAARAGAVLGLRSAG